jgi:hypothetical protein
MGERRKNATKTVICQIDELRLVAGNGIFAFSAPGLKYVWRAVSGFNPITDLARRNRFSAAPPPKFNLSI